VKSLSPERGERVERWEYKVVKATFGADLERVLNQYGYDGWDVVSLAGMDGTFTTTGNKLFAVLRRALPEDAPRPSQTDGASAEGWM
jgi:hypothetical protein